MPGSPGATASGWSRPYKVFTPVRGSAFSGCGGWIAG
jgi:hypothetical protein